MNNKITIEEALDLLRKYGEKNKDIFVNIVIYDDGTGNVRDVKREEIFSFEDVNQLISKLKE